MESKILERLKKGVEFLDHLHATKARPVLHGNLHEKLRVLLAEAAVEMESLLAGKMPTPDLFDDVSDAGSEFDQTEFGKTASLPPPRSPLLKDVEPMLPEHEQGKEVVEPPGLPDVPKSAVAAAKARRKAQRTPPKGR